MLPLVSIEARIYLHTFSLTPYTDCSTHDYHKDRGPVEIIGEDTPAYAILERARKHACTRAEETGTVYMQYCAPSDIY